MSASFGPRLKYKTMVVESGIDYANIQKKLSEFQIEKLTFFFHAFFDSNRDGLIDEKDFKALIVRLRNIAGWNDNSKEALHLEDEMICVLECLLEEVRKDSNQAGEDEGLEFRTWDEALTPSKIKVESITLNQWLLMWAKMFNGAAGINDFPIWVQILPKMLFKVVAKDKNCITKEDLKNFYENFIGLKSPQLEETLAEGYRTMSGDGEYAFDLDNYSLLFCNFLLGRTIYGPGKYIFGCFDNRDMKESYKVIYE